MKKRIASLIFATVTGCLASGMSVAADSYTIDSSHTLVAFELDHLGFSRSLGWVGDVSGSIDYDADNPAASAVTVTLSADSIATNHAERDAWIKSEKVLDTAAQPAISFSSTEVSASDGAIDRIVGDLTMNGVSKPVALDVSFNGAGANPISKKDTIGFSATTVIKRSEWGVDAFVGALGDDVAVRIELEAIKSE